MMTKHHSKHDHQPAGKGKKRSPSSSKDNHPSGRSEGAQAQRNYPEGDYGAIARDEGSSGGMGQRKDNPKRSKAGR